jgi:uncharacterized protein YbaA (DUF1428 family)
MTYVDGFLIPIPKRNLAAYRKLARQGRDAWMKHGALDYKECVADELFSLFPGPDGKMKKAPSLFPKQAGLKRGETILFSFIVFKSKAHRNRVNKKVMADFAAQGGETPEMPFDMARFGYAGFKALVEA